MDIGKIIKYSNKDGTENQIVLLTKIGEGGYGIVFKGMLEGYGLVAVKYQIYMSLFHGESLRNEIAVSEYMSDTYAICLQRIILNSKNSFLYD